MRPAPRAAPAAHSPLTQQNGHAEATGDAHDTLQRQGTIAWRISQNMSGLPAEKIDSAIQANMPRRIHQRSARPDTLGLPGLPGHKAYEVSLDKYKGLHTEGFFKDNPLMRPELEFRQHGYSADPIPYALWRDDWVTGSLLLSFLLLIYIVSRARHQFVLQARNFFYTPQNVETSFAKDITFESRAVLLMSIMLSLLGGFMAYAYSQYTLDLFLSQISPYFLLFIYFGCFLLYFAVKSIAYAFVNWVFFGRAQRKLWSDARSFVLSIECLLFFPAVLVFVYFDVSIRHMAGILIAFLLLAKCLLAYKCFTIFFREIYCLLHFIVYFCALEVVPIIALLQSLTYITGNLIIKY